MKYTWSLILFLFIGASALTIYWSKKAGATERRMSGFTQSYTVLQGALHQMIDFSVDGPQLKNANILDLDYDSIRLGLLFPLEEKKIVFRFKEDQCLDCIDSALAALREFAAAAGTGNVILLASYHDLSRLRALIRVKKIPFKVYNCDAGIFQRPNEDLKSPWLFLMDHKLIAELPLTIQTSQTWLSRYYLSEIRTSLARRYSSEYPITIERTSSIRFDTTNLDLGNIGYKGKATARFGFCNNGSHPLVITSVVTSCGCTTASFPHQPILPGDSSYIEINYDTRRTGVFDRTISVYSNAHQSPTDIKIKGYVEKN
jgi:hypothetical protein